MKRFRFISFLLLLITLGTATAVFNSCKDEEKAPTGNNDQPGTDPDKPSSYAGGISLLGVADHKLSLEVDSSYTFKTMIWPEHATDKTLKWTSSKNSIVSVSEDGTIKALATGSAIITVQIGEGKNFCEVTVLRYVTNVSLNISSGDLILAVKDTVTLAATVLPQDATDNLTWEISTGGEDFVSIGGSKVDPINKHVKYITVTALKVGSAIVTAKAGEKGREKMATYRVTVKYDATHDKGVTIKGVKWATRNVGRPNEFANSPEDKGMFYQWNRNIGWNATGGTWDKTIPTGTTWETTKNVCPEGWRVPTVNEWKSLLNSGSTWNENGRLFDGKIFLPAAGYRKGEDGKLEESDKSGHYWSSEPDESVAEGAYKFYFNEEDKNSEISRNSRNHGLSIRCVEKSE